MKSKLLIIGASGHGRVVADIALKMNKWSSIAFLDDNEEVKSSMGLKVLGGLNEVIKYIDFYDIFVAIGNNEIREKIQENLELMGASLPTLVHPQATISSHVQLGKGVVVMAGAIINCCSVIGNGSIINTGSTIDHDNVIKEYTHISPGAHIAGSVEIERRTWLGVGTIVSNNVKIANDCIIGAGSVVIKDIIEPGTYVGIPARRI